MSFEPLPPSLTAQLTRLLDARKGTSPVVLVFANSAYAAVLDNWLLHAATFCQDNLILFALDAPLHHALSLRGLPVVSINYDGSNESLWMLRLKIFEWFCQAGVDFIHSDADAVWLRDPQPYCSSINVDLVISQGTVWPPDVALDWGFVLCCGFFAVRASHRMALLFERVTDAALALRDDQVALNLVLRTAGVSWAINGLPWDEMKVGDQPFRCYGDVVFGDVPSFGLRLALLPQDDFQRLPRPRQNPYVMHLLTPKEASSKIAALREHGCWRDA